MRGRAGIAALAVLAGLCLAPVCRAAADDPAERLANPAQEVRARELFRQIRCVVCQSETIDESDADLAHDLRQLVREQVRAGRSDAEIRAFLVERYGEFVLMKPSLSPANLVLWLGPFALLAGGGAYLLLRARRSGAISAEAPLTPEEEAKIAVLTQSGPGGHAFASAGSHEDTDNDRRVT